MCLSIPAQIISINNDMAQVSVGGTVVNACLQLIDNPQIGEYVLLHSGFAIEKLNEHEAQETIKLLNNLFEDERNE